MMYQCLTGRIPFSGGTPYEIMSKHANEQVASFSTLNLKLTVSPELEAIVLKALAKKAENRFQSAQELLAALETCDLSKARRKQLSPATTYNLARAMVVVCLVVTVAAAIYQIRESNNASTKIRAAYLVSEAQKDMQLARYPESAKKAAEAIALDPRNHRAYHLRGQVYSARPLFQPDMAIKDLTKAIELAPNQDPVYYYSRSFIYHRERRDREAVADGETAERLWKAGKRGDVLLALPEMLSVRASARARLGDLTGALSDIDQAIQRKRRAGLFYVLKGRMLQRFGYWRESLPPLRHGADIHSAATESHFAIARSLVHLGQFKEAVGQAEIAVQMQFQPDLTRDQNWRQVTGEAYYVAGMVYDKIGKSGAAKSSFAKAADYGVTTEADLDEGW